MKQLETPSEITETVDRMFQYWEENPAPYGSGNPLRDAIAQTGMYYASQDCIAGNCGYERDNSGCNAMRRDAYLKTLFVCS
jgi:hypothetical protein